MGIESLIARRQSQPETPETPPEKPAFQLQATAGVGCTHETPETPQIRKSQPETTAARCVDCQHAEPFEHHPALNHCAAGVESGNPTGAWWSLDTHDCGAFKALSGIYAAILEQAGRHS